MLLLNYDDSEDKIGNFGLRKYKDRGHTTRRVKIKWE